MSILLIQIGQCGNQLGIQLLDYLFKFNNINNV